MFRGNRVLVWTALGGAVGAACIAGGAWAQEDEDGARGETDRIVVTATRRPLPLAEQAGNAVRLEAADLDLIRADHFSEALNRLPGVNVQRGSGQEHLTSIRSPVLTGGAGAGSFLYLEDGVPLRAAGFANVNGLFEAHSEIAGAVEVTRGPGSVLYGSNAVHGLINIITRAPSKEFEAVLEGSTGSFGRHKGRGWVSGTSGAHGLLAGLSLLDENGWREQAGVDQQKLTLRWDYDAGGRFSAKTVLAAVNFNQETAGFILGPDAYKNSALSRTNPNPEAFRDAKALRLSSRMEWGLGDVLLSVTPFARWTDMDFRMHFLPSRALEENGHWSAGVLTTAYWTPAPDWTLIAGLDGEFTRGFLREDQERPTIFDFVQGLHYDYEVDATVAAPYVRAEWRATPRLRLEGGVRVEYTDYAYDNLTNSGLFGRFLRPADRNDDYLTVTPKLGALYDLGSEQTIYARYARGARAPQTTDLYRLQINQTVGGIEAEELDSVEAGWRGAFMGAFYDITAFYMFKRNFFFRDADGFNVPDGKTRHAGLEALAEIPLGEVFTLKAAVTYAHHTYEFDRIVGRSSEIILEGNDVDTAPRVQSNVRLAWHPSESFRTEAEWVHMGEYFMDAANSVTYPGHHVFNLRLVWGATERVQLFATVRNLTNTDYAERADFAFGNERYFPGEDRAFNGGLRVRFGGGD
ncbi:MAG: TonB-dependent receptor [bacterium]